MEPLEAGRTEDAECRECGATNLGHAKFCRNCGAALRIVTPAEPENRRRKESAEERAERIQALREFNRIRDVVRFLRLTFLVGAMFSGLLLVSLWLIRDKLGLLPVLFCGLALAIMSLGFFRVRRQPVMWSTVLASLWTIWTLLLVIVIVIAALPPGPLDLASMALVIPMWAGVAQAMRIQQMMRDHPEFELDRRRLGSETKVRGGVTERAIERRREQRSRGRRRALQLALLAIAVATVGVFVFVQLTAPPSLDSKAALIRSLWIENVDGLVKLVRDDTMRTRFEEAMRQRGLRGGRPALGEPVVDVDHRKIAFPLPATPASREGRLTAHFQFDDRARDWYLTYIELPAVLAPPPETAAAKFATAWDSDDTKELFALLSDQLQNRRTSLEKLLRRKGWDVDRPEIRSTQAGPVADDGSVAIDFVTDDGVIRTRFEYSHPDWRMTRFAPPGDR